ncbi:GAF domain-containing sensor histidine kinase [Loktanella sp. SALINAS62]|uniref:GAF domain-containing sensor histidine kinase n=1 Tax=Loktanella sp. SALINAS62 TaxID=2706124 RepID=UPI001B8AC00B|nr:GAF domain-containing sensor histidine kinase [Loktanella sp. SALINAS62]MBS1303393.1 GAF domain-containing sensor histidine kinase [Loktanella sp. SALINAS62]
MRTYPIPFNEEARLRSLLAVPGLTEGNQAVFEAICEATRKLLDCPIAHISIVEDDTQWYKSVVGIDLERMPKENSFCTYTIMSDAPLVVPDLSKDPRFKRHSMVAEGGPGARYYAGVPLVLSSGHRLGSLCALDLVAHEKPSDQQMAVLAELGKAVVAAFEATPPKPVEKTEDEAVKAGFIALIGHELRTPLTILFGSLRLLEASGGGGTNEKLISSARKSVEHLKSLIETIIVFSDATTGELQLNEQSSELDALLQEMADLRLPGADGELKSITVDKASMPQSALIDSDQIRLALNALVLNAINHGGQEITLNAFRDLEGNLEIQVSDDGNLGDHVELEKLYEPFVVGGSFNHKDTRGGLGLGLPLTRKLVELHGGDFEVRADPDRTTAIIRLPAWRAEVLQKTES